MIRSTLLAAFAAAALVPALLVPGAALADGAIARGKASNSVGLSAHYGTAAGADNRALMECGADDCKIVKEFNNGCAAISHGNGKGAAWIVRSTAAEAESWALDTCRAKGIAQCTVTSTCD